MTDTSRIDVHPEVLAASKSTRTEAGVRQMRAWRKELLEQFEAGDIGDVEFTELALEAGMAWEKIGLALKEKLEE